MSRRAWSWVAQGALGLVVLWFVGRALAHHWAELRSYRFAVAPHLGYLGVMVAAVGCTYALQIGSWNRVLTGWGGRLAYGTAARIWCVANLGRYVPGKLWSVAGLVVMAARAGIDRWTAAASTVAIQALGLGTAVALVAATAPAAASALRLTVAGCIGVATIGVLVWPWAAEQMARRVRVLEGFRPLHAGRALEAAFLTFGAWVTYGVAFWALAKGLGVERLTLAMASGTFALGYLAGLFAIFAPGGIGVRELTFVALLTPIVGPGSAVVLGIASRVVLTITEVTAALAALFLERRIERKHA